MFEEPYRHYVRHQKNRKGNKLRYLVENPPTHGSPAVGVGSFGDSSARNKSPPNTPHKGRRCRKYLPEETYEQWVSGFARQQSCRRNTRQKTLTCRFRQTLIQWQLRSAINRNNSCGRNSNKRSRGRSRGQQQSRNSGFQARNRHPARTSSQMLWTRLSQTRVLTRS